MLLALGVDAERDQHHVLVEVNAADLHYAQVQIAERLRHPLGQRLRRERDEAPRDSVPRHRALAEALGHGVERIPPRREREARQRELARSRRPDPGPLQHDPPTAEHHLAPRTLRSRRAALRHALPLRAAQGFAALIEHRLEHLQARRDHKVEQTLFRVPEDAGQRQRDLNRRHRGQRSDGYG